MNPVDVKNLTVAYEKKAVLKDINFTVPEGQLIGIIGPNGAGKSTLIKAILGLIPKAAGDVKIYDKQYRAKDRIVGYVPQRGSVDWDFPTNALDVVLMGRYGHIGWFKRPSKKDLNIAHESLKKVGMEEYADRQISQLSGGQQQRVFLARALAQDAKVYFMDEPFVGVDAATERAIIDLLNELKSQGKTVLVVHHDLQTVKDYFDHCILLNVSIITSGPTEEVFTMENLHQTYGGKLSFLDKGQMMVEQK
ncbi:metal ABC transporter ATP-binding protein [Cytobacillus purgationiresistens]|uniref:Manganese/zinc/iron transport system ATP-binding protein n=1 Tax=Cytobacillus purgationiresistens TaxID=863449 RepID=A0ABU0AL94_9BACI|nr:metal ABC transporter ATP-binding protein [Cytobacillus purgationiresistens]MDQ0272039.1 manganese/zinc/iron transport system ATP- binding protein [Cytobacillus purgationiresistens]